jgi:hypothetical protein
VSTLDKPLILLDVDGVINAYAHSFGASTITDGRKRKIAFRGRQIPGACMRQEKQFDTPHG